MSAVSTLGMTMADRILSVARKGPVSVMAIAKMHYAGVTPPRSAINVVRTTCARIRKNGLSVNLVDGILTLGANLPSRLVRPAERHGDEALSVREIEMLRILRSFNGVPLSIYDIADEMAPTKSGRSFRPDNVYQVLASMAGKGIAVEKIGRSYRLAGKRRLVDPTARALELKILP